MENWTKLKKPIIGLAPMDGVTDAPFRLLVAKIGKPDIMTTEFVSVEGICAGAMRILKDFKYNEIERPIIAQLFGTDPECFYKAAFVVAKMGFDGVEINMGCPSKNVSSKGAGASLIQTPELAKKIILQTKKGVKNWANGKEIEEIGLPQEILEHISGFKTERKIIPVSVKTRIGYNTNIIEEWTKHLLEAKPANITIHGRTLKQMYTEQADWDAIATATKIIKKTDTTVLGNGDIKTVKEGIEKVKHYGVDGFLIGRAALGNPWIFGDKEADINERLETAKQHAKIYEKIFPEYFLPMRKHLGWYCKGFPGASKIRQELMVSNSAKEVEDILMEIAAKSS